MKSCLVISALVAYASAHGVVRAVTGANGVTMPGLSVQDGTPRDCSSNRCGSQADSSIIRDRDIANGRATALGRTQGAGPVNAATMVNMFMAGAGAAGNGTAAPATAAQLAADVAADPDDDDDKFKLKFVKRQRNRQGGQVVETMVASMAGAGAASGMPTAADDGTVTLTYYQVNGDGAGPLEAAVDGTSGGTQAAAFQTAAITQQLPGRNSRSDNDMSEFQVKVAMPAGMTCDGSIGAAGNMCVVRVRNDAGAGPFGGSAVFTQSTAGRKRAIAYRLKKRMEIRA